MGGRVVPAAVPLVRLALPFIERHVTRAESRDGMRAVATRRPFPAQQIGRTLTNRGSKKRLREIEHRLTRREVLLVAVGAVGLLLFALLSLASFLKHLVDEHSARTAR